RSFNIHYLRSFLTTSPYQGYDVIILSSSTNEEAWFQKRRIDRIFDRIRTDNQYVGNRVIVLSTVVSEHGGQIVGQMLAMRQAEQMAWEDEGIDLRALILEGKIKVAVFHNGGRGERASPISQGLHNSRGAQKLVGTMKGVDGKPFALNLLTTIILNCSIFAETNPGKVIDVFWTSQLCFGTVDFRRIRRTAAPFNKFVIRKDRQSITAKEHADFGKGLFSPDRFMERYYSNKRHAERNKSTGRYMIIEKLRQEWDREGYELGFDFGSFTMSAQLMYALYEFWRDKGLFDAYDLGQITKESGHKRDLDPEFTQPIVLIMDGVSQIDIPEDILPAEILRSIPADERKAQLDEFIPLLQSALPAAIQEELNGAKPKGVREGLEFYLLYRDQPFFNRPKQFAGVVDLGEDSLWLTYRRPIDMMNERFGMISDMCGTCIVINADGSHNQLPSEEKDWLDARQSRAFRGISDNAIGRFMILSDHGFLPIELSREQVDSGVVIEPNGETRVGLPGESVDERLRRGAIYIEDSVVQNTILLPGSRVIHSVVNDTFGEVVCINSYVESVTVFSLVAISSFVHKVICAFNLGFWRQVVTDIFRPGIDDPRYRTKDNQGGQTRIVLPIGYNPQEEVEILGPDGKNLTQEDIIQIGNLQSCAELREKTVDYQMSENVEASCRTQVFEVLHRLPSFRDFDFSHIYSSSGELEIDLIISAALHSDNDESIGLTSSSPLRAYPVSFGTSGIRGPVENLTDRVAYAFGKGFYEYMIGKGFMERGVMMPVAGDLRHSTDRLMAAVARGIAAAGGIALNSGKVPTPAVAYYARQLGLASVMVTASHNPDSENGLKPYLPGEEVLKGDEGTILEYVTQAYNEDAELFDKREMFKEGSKAMEKVSLDRRAETREWYIARYLEFLPGGVLAGKKVLIYEQSSVGREILGEVLEALGAEVYREGYSDVFIPIDSESVKDATRRQIETWVAEYRARGIILDAVVSLDGDGDRPLVFDEEGEYITGDLLNIETAKFLDLDFVAVPNSRNDEIDGEMAAQGIHLKDSDIGSPYVIANMNKAEASGTFRRIGSWECNGGFLLRTSIERGGRLLEALPTRDALLPILAALISSVEQGKSV
ncbi:MAG: hypothetical protein KKC84_01075, partial [Candidatus Omnitrophica bacterium]|nr:hypothetical protein [Candidatus Omnitrophota bacterium]